MPARSLAIVGCGPWGITAREGALKIREGARMLAEGFDTDRLLHGGAVPTSAADGLVVLEPDADPDGLTGAVGDARAQRSGYPVAVAQRRPATAGLPSAARADPDDRAAAAGGRDVCQAAPPEPGRGHHR